MKVKSVLFFYLPLAIILSSCANKRKIEGLIMDQQTGEPIPNFTLSFSVVTGSGIFASKEESKYWATSDEKGIIRFEAEKEDLDNYFWPEQPDICDPNRIESNYKFDHNAEIRYLSEGTRTTLFYNKGGLVKFYNSQSTIDELNPDFVVVKSEYAIDTLRGKNKNPSPLYVAPDQPSTFQFEAVVNGQVTRTMTKEIIIERYCAGGIEQYPVEF